MFLAACFFLGAILAIAAEARKAVDAARLERAEQALIERMHELGRDEAEIAARLEALRRRYRPEEK